MCLNSIFFYNKVTESVSNTRSHFLPNETCFRSFSSKETEYTGPFINHTAYLALGQLPQLCFTFSMSLSTALRHLKSIYNTCKKQWGICYGFGKSRYLMKLFPIYADHMICISITLFVTGRKKQQLMTSSQLSYAPHQHRMLTAQFISFCWGDMLGSNIRSLVQLVKKCHHYQCAIPTVILSLQHVKISMIYQQLSSIVHYSFKHLQKPCGLSVVLRNTNI